jgi:hypothetical protein
MITEDQALHWLWQQYITARTLTDIEYWFERYAVNKGQQKAVQGVTG